MIVFQTQQQRDNTLDALNVMWPSIPPEEVSPGLESWYLASEVEDGCGSLACFGGWCALWPNFQKQGVVAGLGGRPTSNRTNHFFMSVPYMLFGNHGLFISRGGFISDGGFVGTDHELITNRLTWLLENSTVNQQGVVVCQRLRGEG